MNDFERKLRQQAFRQPPPDLRAAIFGAEAKVITPEPWTWRDWFWPSPQAWAALAAVWIVFAALAGYEQNEELPAEVLLPHSSGESPFFAWHHTSHYSDVLEFSN